MAGLHRPIEKGKAVRLDGYAAGFVSTVLSVAPHRFRSHRLNQGPVKLRKQRIANKKTRNACSVRNAGSNRRRPGPGSKHRIRKVQSGDHDGQDKARNEAMIT